jgi:shikimate kinase
MDPSEKGWLNYLTVKYPTRNSVISNMKIFLTGFPGSGKSFFGKAVAEQLDIPFYDLDELIVAETGSSIVEIFKLKGEDYFRTKESEALRTFGPKRKALIATGGGTPCFNHNMEWMNANGMTIYLEASAAFLFHRLVKDKKNRPLIAELTDIELMIYITETLAARTPDYKKSQLIVNAETYTPAKLVSAIRKKISE